MRCTSWAFGSLLIFELVILYLLMAHLARAKLFWLKELALA
jgi:hypothetical protein